MSFGDDTLDPSNRWEAEAKAKQWVFDDSRRFDLRQFLAVQREFNELLQFRRHGRTLGSLSESQRTDAMKDLVLSTAAELFEMLGHLNWKMHKRGRPQDKAKLLEEYVDTFKFVLNFIVYAPFDLEEFVAEFERKSQVVRRRLDEEFEDRAPFHTGLENPGGTSGR